MFCSTCGKTIHATDEVCPHCGAQIGESRFGGTPYTSAQSVIPPNQTSFEPMRNYTRTTYTRKGEEAEEATAVDSRTTYRPVYDDDQSPRKLGYEKNAAPQAQGAAEYSASDIGHAPGAAGVPLSSKSQETLNALEQELLTPEEEIDRSQFRTRPLRAVKRAGTSPDVEEYIRQLEDSQSRKANARRRRRADYDDYAADAGEGEYAPQSDEAAMDGEGDQQYAEPAEGEQDYGDGYADDDYDDPGYYNDRRFPFDMYQVLRIVAAVAVVLLLVFGITRLVGYVGGHQNDSPIEGVSKDLYERGIELIRSHTAQDYINNLVSSYATDGMIVTSQKLDQGKDAIRALMPAEPASYDQTFVDALLKIEDNIGNAVLMDGIAATNPSADSSAASESNWQTVNDSVTQLEAAKSYSDLNTIIGGATITVQSKTPEPTSTAPLYNILAKGDENNEVMQLQVRLYNLGYLNDNRDGVYGSKTATAVGLFQQRAGLPVNGNVADNATQVALYADDAPYAAGHETPEPSPSPTPEPTEEVIQPAEANGTTV